MSEAEDKRVADMHAGVIPQYAAQYATEATLSQRNFVPRIEERSWDRNEQNDRIRFLLDLLRVKYPQAVVTFIRLTHRTRVAVIREPDGWETVGVSSTQTKDNPDTGNRWALEDACNKIGGGRLWHGNTADQLHV